MSILQDILIARAMLNEKKLPVDVEFRQLRDEEYAQEFMTAFPEIDTRSPVSIPPGGCERQVSRQSDEPVMRVSRRSR